MRFLLDTHCWLWLLAAPERFDPKTLDKLADPNQDLLLSAASGWEIAIKHALGKLPLPEPPSTYVPSRMRASGVRALDVTMTHSLQVSLLPAHHRDPFDRILVAQAQVEQLVLVTADRALDAYEVERLPV